MCKYICKCLYTECIHTVRNICIQYINLFVKVKLISSSLHQVFMFLGHTSGEGGGKEETVGAVGPRKAANRSNSCLHQHHPHIRSPVVSGTSSLLPQTLLDSNGCFQHHSHASLCLSWAPAWMKEFACQVFFFFAFCSKIQKHYHLKSHCLLRPVFSSTKSLTLTDVMIWTEPEHLPQITAAKRFVQSTGTCEMI